MALKDILNGIKQNQDEAVEAGKSIHAKKDMVAQYEAATPYQSGAKATTVPGAVSSSPKDRVNRPVEKRLDPKMVDDARKPLGSFKKGGKVKKTGVYKLHAKEQVINAKQTAKVAKKGGLAAVLSGK